MKNSFLAMAAAAISFAACNSNNTTSKDKTDKSSDTTQSKVQTNTTAAETKGTASVNELISSYLQLKNALTGDNAKEAASAGNTLSETIGKIDKSTFTPDQKKVYDEVEADIKEHGEHIGANADKIAHQREHFEMLSKDIYDLVKAFGGGQKLYKDYCPMYNEGKGATWISETKEIKNPYLGKKMPTCGSVKEEIK